MTNIIDVETEIMEYLKYEGIPAENIYTINFPLSRELDYEILIAREGSGPMEVYLPQDSPRIRIEVRAGHPQTSYDMILEVINKLHKVANSMIGRLYCYWSEITGGPEFIKDSTTGMESHVAYFTLKVREA